MSDEIRFLQELSILTWPPKMILNLNGWKVRISEGITKRANSVSPMEYSGKNLIDDISTAENYFRVNKLPSIFQLPDSFKPASLQEELLSLNYKIVDETIVMVANIDGLDFPKINEEFDIHRLENELDNWLNEQQKINPTSQSQIDGRREILSRIAQSNAGYFLAKEGNKTVAVGLAILQENYMVIYSMFTHPDYRRKGIAQNLMIKMIEWGDLNLVDYVFLQVESVNTPAKHLYEKVGFKEKYRYRYLVKEF
jgi:ribosomal protein S18 acetylase RimI-like enzyme